MPGSEKSGDTMPDSALPDTSFFIRSLNGNDKLFAQADIESNIKYYVTSDTESLKAFELIKQQCNPKFNIVDINQPLSEAFGILDLK